MSYSDVADHRTMVLDDVRNRAYLEAIAKHVTPDTVVLDLGAGVGILGLLAAKAGARRVYLVEPEPVVQVAREFAAANGLADRIVILQGRIEDIELPEPVDLILSVFTGSLLFSEDLLPSLFHARDRFLKAGGSLLPDRAELLLAPLTAPTLHATHVESWSSTRQGLELAAARRYAANHIVWLPRKELSGTQIAGAAVVSEIDLMNATKADCEGVASTLVHTAGLCHGLLGWIRFRLGDTWLGTGPAEPELHWPNAFLPLDPPLQLGKGEAVAISLQRPEYGDWTWTVRTKKDVRRHSSFLGRLDGVDRLSRMAPLAQARLGQKGLAAQQALTLMQMGKNNQEIAGQLVVDFALLFANENAALRFVGRIANEFGVSR